MVGKKNFIKTIVTCILICCLGFSGCGAGSHDTEANNAENNSTENNSAKIDDVEASGSGAEPAQSPQPAPSSPPASAEEADRVPIPVQVVPEGREVVTLGVFGANPNMVSSASPMYKAVTAFNQAQEKYFVKIEIYKSYNRFLIDIARKQGTDLYNLYWGVSPDLLVRQGILEDLTPYFESSDAVSREDIVDAVWRAGSEDDKLYFLIPGFTCHGILVEKGHTKDGAWSGRDYIELGKKYPGSMLNKRIQDPTGQILSQLSEYMAAFIDWEERTCSFDSDEFIALLEDLKALGNYNYEAVDTNATTADLIRGKTYLSETVTLSMEPGMFCYREIADAFGDGYEIAGYPTADGSLKYALEYYDQIYGMNAASENKEGAWAFLEYLVSEEYQQPQPPSYIRGYSPLLGTCFPARKDSLEQGLQAIVDYVTPPDENPHYYISRYTKERMADGYEGFTEEDKQAVLRVIDNSYRQAFDHDYTLLNILFEETEPFFQGDKSAKDVVMIIQSRVSLYLIE